MATPKDAFEKRERAAEEVWFRQEERGHMLKRLEKLVELAAHDAMQGKLDASVLDEVRKATSPDVHHATGVEVSPGVFKDVPGELKHREERVFERAPGSVPVPKESETEGMRALHGSHVDMGPSRWSPGGESIFALKDSLAEPAANKALPAHEVARLARMQAQAGTVEVPTLFGYKLPPSGMAPGRMFFWGSVLAVTGTAALVAASARGLGPVRPAERAPPAEPGTLSAMGQRVRDFFMPWRASVEARQASRAELEAEQGEFVRRIKQRMIEGRA